jgi:hypothetical protein
MLQGCYKGAYESAAWGVSAFDVSSAAGILNDGVCGSTGGRGVAPSSAPHAHVRAATHLLTLGTASGKLPFVLGTVISFEEKSDGHTPTRLKMSQGCYKGVTRLSQGCYKGVSRAIQTQAHTRTHTHMHTHAHTRTHAHTLSLAHLSKEGPGGPLIPGRTFVSAVFFSV